LQKNFDFGAEAERAHGMHERR